MPDRFWSKVRRSPGCWEWLAHRDKDGYGTFKKSWRESSTGAHRVAYELAVGPIPAELQIDHLCRNRGCVNPRHLEAVTGQVNTLRGESIPAQNAVKRVCKRGHPLSGDNLYINPKHERQCIVCQRVRERVYKTSRRSA